MRGSKTWWRPGPLTRGAMLVYRRLTAIALPLGLLVGFPAWAASGRVLDSEGKPIAGAQACYVGGPEVGDCTKTDSEGFYSLPDRAGRSVRILHPDYVLQRVAATDLDRPVRLQRAAILEVKFLTDPGDTPVEGVVFFVTRADGNRLGPLGPTNASGTVIAESLPPGGVTVSVYAPGYHAVPGKNVLLESGNQASLTFRLKRRDDAAGR